MENLPLFLSSCTKPIFHKNGSAAHADTSQVLIVAIQLAMVSSAPSDVNGLWHLGVCMSEAHDAGIFVSLPKGKDCPWHLTHVGCGSGEIWTASRYDMNSSSQYRCGNGPVAHLAKEQVEGLLIPIVLW